eukprot:22267-Chlamydomonas_euryale.AAC.1
MDEWQGGWGSGKAKGTETVRGKERARMGRFRINVAAAKSRSGTSCKAKERHILHKAGKMTHACKCVYATTHVCVGGGEGYQTGTCSKALPDPLNRVPLGTPLALRALH